MKSSDQDLSRLFDGATLARGRNYAAEGRVIRMNSDGAQLTATVKGSGRSLYRQTIRLSKDVTGRITSVSGVCTCPMGLNCKHVAAVLCAYAPAGSRQPYPDRHAPQAQAQAPKPRQAAQAPSLPHSLAFWLADLKAADERKDEDPDLWPSTVRERLLYVLKEGLGKRLIVETMKAQLLRSGDFGKASRYDAMRVLHTNPPKFIRAVDIRIIRRISLLGLSTYATETAGSGEIIDLLNLVAATGRGRWDSDAGPTLTASEPRKGILSWKTLESGGQILEIRGEDDRPLMPLPIQPPAFIDAATGHFGRLELDGASRIMPLLMKSPEIPVEHAAKVAAGLAGLTTLSIPAPRTLESEHRKGRSPLPILTLFTTAATSRYQNWGQAENRYKVPTLRLDFDYDGRRLPYSQAETETFLENGKAVRLARDVKFETKAYRQLLAGKAKPVNGLGDIRPTRDMREHDLFFPIADAWSKDQDTSFFDGEPLAFMASTLPELRKAGWTIEIASDWPYPFYEGPVEIGAAVTPEAGDKSGSRFKLGLQLTAGSAQLDLAPLIFSVLDQITELGPLIDDQQAALEAILEDTTLFQRLEDGRYVELDASKLIPLLNVFLSASGLMNGFHRAEAGRLRELADALEGYGGRFEVGPDLLALGERLHRLGAADPVKPPPSVQATLRPYQKTGYGWLKALSDTGFGGVLADDMGLGKTIQTLALLAERHLQQGADRPSLLVAPTSIVHAWRRQAAQFVPDLKVLVLQGSDRKSDFDAIDDHHLVITTYPLLNRDHAALMPRQWEIAILDEAQAVKNPASAVAKRIRDIDARMRLALTGTPLENSLSDLWSLYDWLIPGLLGDRKDFRQRFLQPIEKFGDARAQAELNARILPFLLRRTKAQVALDLPEKVEITELVSFGDGQRGVYEAMRLAMDERVRKTIAEKGLAASHITILDALLKLRQICCDPKLLKHKKADSIEDSAKRERLLELLDDLVAEGRRVLVFSQFVEMLTLIEADIKARNWRYSMLTGDTVNRDAVVTAFQSGEIPVFLISLKAGGVGLTLTAADTVILYDPWWNPAAERQAMDRAHRIGQDKKVFVYRLIAEGTVEQAIAALQERKQALADALFEGTASGPMSLDETEIAALFGPIGDGGR